MNKAPASTGAGFLPPSTGFVYVCLHLNNKDADVSYHPQLSSELLLFFFRSLWLPVDDTVSSDILTKKNLGMLGIYKLFTLFKTNITMEHHSF